VHFETKILYDFIKDRKKFYTASIIITILGILSLFIFQMNLGIDFQAGTAMDAVTKNAVTQADVASVLKEKGYEEIPTVGGTNNDRISIRFKEVLESSEVTAIQSAFKDKFGSGTDFETNVVSPDMARELGLKAILGIIIASLMIMVYVMFRFEWRFGIAANISILYDCFVVIAIFSIFRLEVDLPFIAAVLTTLGYSINDKVVIFDRIRENLRFNPPKGEAQLAELVNASIWQTMARSLYTVFAILIVTLFIFFFGSESIRLFSLAILIGLVSGAYSTMCIASPIWYELKKKEKKKNKTAAVTKPTL